MLLRAGSGYRLRRHLRTSSPVRISLECLASEVGLCPESNSAESARHITALARRTALKVWQTLLYTKPSVSGSVSVVLSARLSAAALCLKRSAIQVMRPLQPVTSLLMGKPQIAWVKAVGGFIPVLLRLDAGCIAGKFRFVKRAAARWSKFQRRGIGNCLARRNLLLLDEMRVHCCQNAAGIKARGRCRPSAVQQTDVFQALIWVSASSIAHSRPAKSISGRLPPFTEVAKCISLRYGLAADSRGYHLLVSLEVNTMSRSLCEPGSWLRHLIKALGRAGHRPIVQESIGRWSIMAVVHLRGDQAGH